MNSETAAAFGSNCTAVVLVAIIIWAGVWDVIAGLLWGEQATITYVVGQWSKEVPILPILVGIVMGHLFWPRRPN